MAEGLRRNRTILGRGGHRGCRAEKLVVFGYDVEMGTGVGHQLTLVTVDSVTAMVNCGELAKLVLNGTV